MPHISQSLYELYSYYVISRTDVLQNAAIHPVNGTRAPFFSPCSKLRTFFLEMDSFTRMQRSGTWEWLGQSPGLAGSGATHLSTSPPRSGRICVDVMTSPSWESTVLCSQDLLPFSHTLVLCLNCFYQNDISPCSEFTLTTAPHYHSFFSAHWQICRHLPFF